MTMHIECQHFPVYSKQYGLLCTILKYMLVITEMCYVYTMVFDDIGESLSVWKPVISITQTYALIRMQFMCTFLSVCKNDENIDFLTFQGFLRYRKHSAARV